MYIWISNPPFHWLMFLELMARGSRFHCFINMPLLFGGVMTPYGSQRRSYGED